MAAKNSTTSTRAVERALNLLAEVCDSGPVSLSECARRVDLAPTTALRLLRTLEATGFVNRDASGSFQVGVRMTQLGASALGRESLVRLADPGMRRIVKATRESTYLATRGSDDTAVYIAMVEGTYAIRHTSWVGRSVPLAHLAVGKALTGQVPACGYVTERNALEPDVTAVVAPIRWPGGVAGTLSLLGPTYRIDDSTLHDYGRVVAREARTIGAQLNPPPRGAQKEVVAAR